MELKFKDILKVADIEREQLYLEFAKFLQDSVEPTYRDQILKEHIYSVWDIVDELESSDDKIAPMFTESLEAIREFCNENDCGYFRVLYS